MTFKGWTPWWTPNPDFYGDQGSNIEGAIKSRFFELILEYSARGEVSFPPFLGTGLFPQIAQYPFLPFLDFLGHFSSPDCIAQR
jgi:hypothetical protein